MDENGVSTQWLHKHDKRASVFCTEALFQIQYIVVLLRHSLLNGNRNCDRRAYHRVVAQEIWVFQSILNCIKKAQFFRKKWL